MTFALQGPLSNYGACLSIILSRPFVVGNTVTVKGVSGVVEEVSLAVTVLRGEDGERITVPNKHVVGKVIVNSRNSRIVESRIGIALEAAPSPPATASPMSLCPRSASTTSLTAASSWAPPSESRARPTSKAATTPTAPSSRPSRATATSCCRR